MSNLVTEEYIGYGRKTDLQKMNLTDLLGELKMAQTQIESCKEEVDGADGYPSFALKEKLQNAEYYKKEVQKQIDRLSEEEIKNGNIDGLISDLKKQLSKNTITKEYYDKAVEDLENKRELFEKQEKELEEKKSKKHNFKIFKKNLKDYSNKED
jgi:chromosome segregation ATPase